MEGEFGAEATGNKARVSALSKAGVAPFADPGKVNDLAASISPLLAFITPAAVTVVFPACSSFSSSAVNEPIEEERLSELACEKMEHEVADPRLVVDDREEGRANGSDADEHDEEEEVIESLVYRGGDVNLPSRDGVVALAMVLPPDEDVEAVSPLAVADVEKDGT